MLVHKHTHVQGGDLQRVLAHASASTSQPGAPPQSCLPEDVAVRWQQQDAEVLADVRELIVGECSEAASPPCWSILGLLMPF